MPLSAASQVREDETNEAIPLVLVVLRVSLFLCIPNRRDAHCEWAVSVSFKGYGLEKCPFRGTRVGVRIVSDRGPYPCEYP